MAAHGRLASQRQASRHEHGENQLHDRKMRRHQLKHVEQPLMNLSMHDLNQALVHLLPLARCLSHGHDASVVMPITIILLVLSVLTDPTLLHPVRTTPLSVSSRHSAHALKVPNRVFFIFYCLVRVTPKPRCPSTTSTTTTGTTTITVRTATTAAAPLQVQRGRPRHAQRLQLQRSFELPLNRHVAHRLTASNINSNTQHDRDNSNLANCKAPTTARTAPATTQRAQ